MASKKSKYLFFWLPYDVKYTYETFLTSFYLSIKRFSSDDALHIGHGKIFEAIPSHLPENWLKDYHSDMPTNDDLASIDKIIWGSEVFQDLEKQLKSKNLVWEYILKHEYEPLMNLFENELVKIKQLYNIKAIILWSNCPSIKKIAHQHQIPVIHNEMGPLREPVYLPTCYFDFSGVNGNTEAKSRFEAFNKLDYSSDGIGRIALLSLFSKVVRPIRKFDEYQVGLPLQVEDDSNIIAFSNGFDNNELIEYARSVANKVLIRKHPYGRADYQGVEPDSQGLTPQEFINVCERIITINSSVGLEALLLGKPSEILGDSPFKFIDLNDDLFVKKLRFALLNYLIPFQFLFDKEYYDWRISMPSEKEIETKHLNFYLNEKHGWSLENANLSRLENDLQVIFYRNLNLQFVEKETALKKEVDEAKQESIELKKVIAQSQNMLKESSDLKNKVDILEQELHQVREREQHYLHELNRHQHVIRDIYLSRSWRLTKPLRTLNSVKIKKYNKSYIKSVILKFALPVAKKLISNYKIRGVIVTITKKLGLYGRLKAIYLRNGSGATSSVAVITNEHDLSRDTAINIKKIKMLKNQRGKD